MDCYNDPMSADRPTVSIIGAGKVGTAVGVLLSRAEYQLAAFSSRNQAHADAAASLTGARATLDATEAAQEGSIIFITTPDDVIEQVCAQIAAGGGFSPGDTVFHMSGAAANDVLEPARRAGASVGSIHPIQSFADVDGAIDALAGSVFGVTADDNALAVARDIVEALGGTVAQIAEDQKRLYHAAACIASNYMVVLADYAEELYRTIGIDADTARKAYLPLIEGTRANIARKGPADALTGPIARADISTVRDHLTAMAAAGLDSSPYRMLGGRAAEIARRRGSLSEAGFEKIVAVLREEELSREPGEGEETLP